MNRNSFTLSAHDVALAKGLDVPLLPKVAEHTPPQPGPSPEPAPDPAPQPNAARVKA